MIKRNIKQELYRFTKIKYKIDVINIRYEDTL